MEWSQGLPRGDGASWGDGLQLGLDPVELLPQLGAELGFNQRVEVNEGGFCGSALVAGADRGNKADVEVVRLA